MSVFKTVAVKIDGERELEHGFYVGFEGNPVFIDQDGWWMEVPPEDELYGQLMDQAYDVAGNELDAPEEKCSALEGASSPQELVDALEAFIGSLEDAVLGKRILSLDDMSQVATVKIATGSVYDWKPIYYGYGYDFKKGKRVKVSARKYVPELPDRYRSDFPRRPSLPAERPDVLSVKPFEKVQATRAGRDGYKDFGKAMDAVVPSEPYPVGFRFEPGSMIRQILKYINNETQIQSFAGNPLSVEESTTAFDDLLKSIALLHDEDVLVDVAGRLERNKDGRLKANRVGVRINLGGMFSGTGEYYQIVGKQGSDDYVNLKVKRCQPLDDGQALPEGVDAAEFVRSHASSLSALRLGADGGMPVEPEAPAADATCSQKPVWSVKKLKEGGGCRLTAYRGYETNLVVPREIDGFTVVEIGQLVVKNARDAVRSIELPDSVRAIRNKAFSNCKALERIVIPRGVETIGVEAFSRCSSLREVVLPEMILSIGGGAFFECASLENISFPEGLTTIEGAAFQGCTSLEDVVFPSTLRKLEGSAFEGCRSLAHVDLSKCARLRRLRNTQFKDCTSLAQVELRPSIIIEGPDWMYPFLNTPYGKSFGQ